MSPTRTATQWGVYDVGVRDGAIDSVTPLAHDPDPSPIGAVLLDGVQHPLRISRPAVREGGCAAVRSELERDVAPNRSSRSRGTKRWTSRRTSSNA